MRHYRKAVLFGWLSSLNALSSAAHCSHSNITSLEFDTLKQFYFSCNGPNWNWAMNDPRFHWNFDTDDYSAPCTKPWDGLSCTFLGTLCSIESISLNGYNLSCPFPEMLRHLRSLNNINLGTNSLEGTIPSEIGLFLNVTSLYIAVNRLSGTIPNELFRWPDLRQLSLGNNQFSGSILDRLPHSLSFLSADNNKFTGSFPSDFSCVQDSIFLDNNFFTGPLPAGLAFSAGDSFCPTRLLQLGPNFFTGTFPSSYCLFGLVDVFAINENLLEGTLPDCFNSMSQVEILELNGNHFSGSIPSTLVLPTKLSALYFQDNSFTGTLPTEYQVNSSLGFIYGSNNQLTGEIPSTLSSLSNLVDLALSYNHLTGRYPASINQKTLVQVGVNDNRLSGSIPGELSQLKRLLELQFANNHLTGGIDQLVVGNQLVSLQTLHLDRNELTGLLPNELFSLPHLRSLSLASNCFYGSIPESICGVSSLEAIVMDGLSDSDACAVEISPLLSYFVKAHFAENLMSGNLPNCIWNLPNISFLHAAGNGLGGAIPELQMDSRLSKVSVSRNRLHGSIPCSLLERVGVMEQLDLSFNLLSGTLCKSFDVSPESYINLTVNRLSGEIPQSLRDAEQIAILDGNLLQCSSGTIPVNDPQHDGYSCGSSNYDNIAVAWMVLLSVAVTAATSLYVFGGGKRLCLQIAPFAESFKSIERWWTALSAVLNEMTEFETVRFLTFLRKSSFICFVVAAISVLILLPAYLGMKLGPFREFYSTHQNQYLWTSTNAFLHGLFPLLLVSIIVLFCVSGACAAIAAMFPPADDVEISFVKSWSSRLSTSCQVVLWQMVNVVVVLTVNGGYVSAVLTSNPNLPWIQMGMSLFKIGWSTIYIPYAILQLRRLSARNIVRNELFMRIFNLIVAPCLATAFTDSNCFLNVFVGSTSIVTSFIETILIGSPLHGPTKVETQVIISIEPPWSYSYQCSASLITSYVPVLLTVYTVSLFLIPTILFAVALIPPAVLRRSAVLRFFVRRVDVLWLDGLHEQKDRDAKPLPLEDPRKDVASLNVGAQDNTRAVGSLASNGEIEDALIRPKFLFRAQRMVSIIMQHLTVVLTFGMSSPLLAVAVAATALAEGSLWQLLLGRYLVLTRLGREAALEQLERATTNVWKGPPYCIPAVAAAVGFYWCLQAFDMAGDVYGFVSATVALVSVFVGILLGVYGSLKCLRLYYVRRTSYHPVQMEKGTSNDGM